MNKKCEIEMQGRKEGNENQKEKSKRSLQMKRILDKIIDTSLVAQSNIDRKFDSFN